jgi:hypothetical protein
MLCLELPNGTYVDFDSAEALALAAKKVREGKPIVIRREDGGEEILWSPDDERTN